MAKYQDNNILFTNVIRPSILTSGRISKGRYGLDENENIINKEGAVLNAIDIDWNGAYLESLNTYINSTGDLLKQINYIYQLINDLPEVNINDYIKRDELTDEYLENKLSDIFAPKSVEDSISSFTESLNNKANISDIPQHISELSGIESYATIVWVNSQLRNYSKSPYDVYIDNGGTLSQTQWLESLKGKDGVNGYSAYDIAKQIDPYIGSQYEWIQSLQGRNGYSAYELAYNENPSIGTLQEWLLSLKGEQGEPGINGKSAYEIAVQNGYEGTEEEWLLSLKGDKGDKGERGEKGENGTGVNILGSYDTLEELKNATLNTLNSIGDAYIVNGDIYTYNDLFESIDDKWKYSGQIKGERGEDGKSAYDIYCEIEETLGRTPLSKENWISSLNGERGEQGQKGEDGKSAYDIYCEIEETLGRTPLSKENWIESLHGEPIQYSAGNGISISNNTISINKSDIWEIIQN